MHDYLIQITVVLNCPTSDEIKNKLLSHPAAATVTFEGEKIWTYVISVPSKDANNYMKWAKQQDYVNSVDRPGKVTAC